ncbi:hypothetical protein CCP1ISM_90017 [Azospirillaceae bacterium]
MNTATNHITPTEAELELRKRRKEIIKELRDVIISTAADQAPLRQSTKEKSREGKHDEAGSCMSQRWNNRSNITAALVLYAEIRGKKPSHKMDWLSEMLHGKLIQKFGAATIEELKQYSARPS